MLVRVMRGWRRKVVVSVGAFVGLLLVAAWANSYRRHEVVGWGSDRRALSVAVTRGSLALRNLRLEASGNNAVRLHTPGWYHNSSRPAPMTRAFYARDCDIYWSLGPFSFLHGGRSAGMPTSWRVSGYELIVPLWFVAVVAAAVFALLFRLTRPRPTPGLCATCGYDLRASPDRCPECGAVA
jgi:hypothetical protein